MLSIEEIVASFLKIKEMVEQLIQTQERVPDKRKDFRSNLNENLSYMEHEICAIQDEEYVTDV